MIRLALVLFTLLFCSPPGQAADGWKVTDGDSLAAPWGEQLRVGNIDTPEIGSRCKCPAECALGARASAFTKDVVARARRVTLMPYTEPGRTFREQGKSGPLDQYRRSLVLVSIDGRDLGGMLVAAGLARPWTGKRQPWC